MWFILTLGVFDALILALVLVAGAHIFFSFRNAVPPVMTPREATPEILEELNLPKKGVFYELGCGDGRILAAVCRLRPSLSVVGIDNNPVLLALARLRLGKKATLVRGDILAQSLDEATRVFAYLGPELMLALESKLEREMPAGSRLVSQQFPLPTRVPIREVTLKRGKAHAARLYVYDY